MRIDYSGPKKSCSSPQLSQNQNRPRKESSGGTLIIVFFTSLLSLGIGFGSGWMLSQRAAKEGFKAAMAQQSLENSPQQPKIQPSPQQNDGAAQTQQQQPGNPTPLPGTAGGAPTTGTPPLSFYKTLPSGQKNNVLGSGINIKDDKPGKQPLQAAMPSNITRPAPPEGDDNIQKQSVSPTPAKAGATNQNANSFTVQVASYSLKSEAETARSILAAKGYSVIIIESHLGDKGTWYRVRVGKHLDKDAAKELATKIGKGAISIPDRD
ncbi:MAG: SPOR domain-containing protein [Desulfuromonadaceae bacterium]|nr:SPOR domain-containing protein [Desulfuromonadaceae bacterium]